MEPTPEQIQEELAALNAKLEAKGLPHRHDVAKGQFNRYFLVSSIPGEFPSRLSQPYGARGILTIIRTLTVQFE